MKIEKPIYSAHVSSTGGRDGRAVSSDRNLDIKLSTPKELGGLGGEGSNPEQLFAAGYSACFLNAIKFVAGKAKIKCPDSAKVEARVGIGALSTGFGLEVDLRIHLPDTPHETVKDLVQQAHKVCPYSNATRNNINVNLEII